MASSFKSARIIPGVKQHLPNELVEILVSAQASNSFRSEATRCNYFGRDRRDIAFATKELCRRISVPHQASQHVLQRLTRLLNDGKRLRFFFPLATRLRFRRFCRYRFRKLHGYETQHIRWGSELR